MMREKIQIMNKNVKLDEWNQKRKQRQRRKRRRPPDDDDDIDDDDNDNDEQYWHMKQLNEISSDQHIKKLFLFMSTRRIRIRIRQKRLRRLLLQRSLSLLIDNLLWTCCTTTMELKEKNMKWMKNDAKMSAATTRVTIICCLLHFTLWAMLKMTMIMVVAIMMMMTVFIHGVIIMVIIDNKQNERKNENEFPSV